MAVSIQEVKDRADLPAIVEALTGHPGRNGMYHCPVCGSGDGPNHSGAFHILPDSGGKSWYCHACNNRGDVLDLAGLVLQTDDFEAKKRLAMEWAGIDPNAQEGNRKAPAAMSPERAPLAPQQPRREPSADEIERQRAYIERARLDIDAPDALEYLAGRGIDADTAHRLGLGYDPERRRIVIPFPGSDHYHTDRATGHGGAGKYLKPKGVPQPLWNPAALDGDLAIVVEGPMDALALDLAGYGQQAVALCGTAWRSLIDELRARKWQGTVLVALDADEAGGKAQGEMLDALTDAEITATGLSVWGDLRVKDAGEAWQSDPDAMRQRLDVAVPEGMDRARVERERAEERRLEDGLDRLHVVDSMPALGNVLMLTGVGEPVPTGFDALDRVLGGGLYPGLYVLGATSSMGKTTFLGQVADAVAASGRGVLFVTLEQSAEEMAAKALSRSMATHLGPDGKLHDVSALDLLRPSWRTTGPGADPVMFQAIRTACEAYMDETGGRVRYLVGDGEPPVSDVAAVARHEARRLGQPPLVIVDYLQILAAPRESLSDKQATDRNVTALRRLARDLGGPVLAISSLNRASYSGAVTMEAFKESGSIEYAADVLMGLQPRDMGSELDGVGEKEAARKGRKIVNETKLQAERQVEVTVLKNRWGRITGHASGVPMVYHCITNRFVESTAMCPD